MSNLINLDTNEQPKLRDAAERVRPKFSAIPQDRLLPILVDPIAATATTQGALPEILLYREQLISELPKFDISNLDQLDLYALALIQTHSEHITASIPPEEFSKLAEEAGGLRELLLADATALAKRGHINAAALNKLQGSVGYRNVAVDVLSLVTLIRREWAKVASKTGVTEAELNRAEVIGEKLIRAIGLREQGPTTIAAAALKRQQAYTLFVNAYNQIRRAIHYLRWDVGIRTTLLRPYSAEKQLERSPSKYRYQRPRHQRRLPPRRYKWLRRRRRNQRWDCPVRIHSPIESRRTHL